MTQENKDLLLKDLCSRLPYGVKVEYENKIFDIDYISAKYGELKLDNYLYNYTIDIGEVKPYLFPLSSMTEEQFNEMYNYCYNAERESSKFSNGELKIIYTYELIKIDWLTRNHFDYRGLIPKGLANDATGLNIY